MVTRTATGIADELGWTHLRLESVARILCVRQPSLYKHVDCLAAMRREVSVLAVGELGAELIAAVAGRSATEALHAIATTYRGYAHAHAHPGRYAATVVAPAADDHKNTLVAEQIFTALAAVLHGYQLSDEDTLHAIRALRAMLHGFVTLEAADGYAMDLDLDKSYHQMVTRFDAGLRTTTAKPNRPGPGSVAGTSGEVCPMVLVTSTAAARPLTQ